MANWTVNVPCLKFVHKTGQQDFLSFFRGKG